MSINRLITYQELYENYMSKVKGLGTYHTPNYIMLADFEDWVKYQSVGNRAFVLLDVATGEYVKWYNIFEKFGYTNEEFTAAAVNNLAKLKLIPEDQIEHKKRYTSIIMEVLGLNEEFTVRTDSYSVEFKIIHKNGEHIPVRRKSIIFQTQDGIEPLSRLDEWEILIKHHADYVYPEISTDNKEKTAKLNEIFYRKNWKIVLNGDFFPLQKRQVFDLKLRGYTNMEIALKLELKEKRIEKLFNEISSLFREKFNIDHIEGASKIKLLARTWGLFPIPARLLSTHE